MTAMPLPKFTYLDLKGFGEAIRLALYIGNVQFEDHLVSRAECVEMEKAGKLPFGQVPVLEADGEIYAQSGVILKWAGRQSGLYPEDEKLQMRCDEIYDTLTDIKRVLFPAWHGGICGRNPFTKQPLVPIPDELKGDVLKGLNEVWLPYRMGQLERALEKFGGPYFCGARMTVCDLEFYVMGLGFLTECYVDGVKSTIMDGCPLLKQLVERVGNNPKVTEWNALHPNSHY